MALWFRTKSIKGSVLCLGILIGCCCAPAQAAEISGQQLQLALGVSPAITELILEPGQAKKYVVTVTNMTNGPFPVKAAAAPFELREEVAAKDRARFDASKWIQFSEPDFILHAKQQKSVAITVNPPNNAEPGGHYTTIFFQPLVPAEVIKNNAVLIGSKVGVMTLLVVKGEIKEGAYIDNFSLPLLNQQGPLELQIAITNTGNVHIMPVGSIEIRDLGGNRVDTITLPPSLVLPKTTKVIPIKWDNNQKTGYFSAQAVIKHGTSQEALTGGRVGFLIFPWLNLVLFLVPLGIIGFGLWRTRGRWRRALGALAGKGGL